MAAKKRKKPADRAAVVRHEEAVERAPRLRIIGGHHRGRVLAYSGDPRTRPMKDRVREAVFNLIGAEVKGKLAVDLFAGTGALGLEEISRGARGAVFLERHFPTAAVIRQNVATLDAAQIAEVLAADTFIWARRQLPAGEIPWLVFCSPPYAFYADRRDDMLSLVTRLLEASPPGSVLVVEADESFDMQLLPQADQWDVRAYPPAVVAIYRKPSAETESR
jgi:16S rRNA (guanine(966)-N(2))-methyltransferase RsmD